MRALLACVLATGCGAELGDPPVTGRDHGASCSTDIVFAVDTSGSTSKEQSALRDAFPDFADRLGPYRAALVDGCATPASFHTRGQSGDCHFASGHPWIESSSPRADDELDCVAEIDSSAAQCVGNGDDQAPVTTAITALEPAWAGSGAPNAGFLRDNALLVIVAITDQDEHPIPGASMQHTYERLVAAKGNANRVVFVGFGGESRCDGPYGPEEDADKLQELTQLFGSRGVFWDLCGGQLDDGMQKAADTIANACGS
jgi:hypothetical protein